MTPAEAGAAGRDELIRRVLDSLVAERQRLRSSAVEPALLEANRLAIVYWQNELVREIALAHGSAPAAATPPAA
jgi:hypothetical protein